MATLSDLANAIARFEGFLVPGSIAQRDNNPGNLRSGPGQIGTDSGGYAIFPDVATGQAALQRQVQLNVDRGLSLDEFFGGKPGVYPGYAPSGDSNDPGHYSQTVAEWLGIDNHTPLSQVIGGTPAGSTATVSDFTLGADLSSWLGDSALTDTGNGTGLSGLAWGAMAAVLIGVLYASFGDT